MEEVGSDIGQHDLTSSSMPKKKCNIITWNWHFAESAAHKFSGKCMEAQKQHI